MKHQRPVFDEYTQEFLHNIQVVSKIESIDDGRSPFYSSKEGGSGQYCLTRRPLDQASGTAAQPGIPTPDQLFDLSRLADSQFGAIQLGLELSFEDGEALMDWMVAHDWQMRKALKQFAISPNDLFALIERAWNEI